MTLPESQRAYPKSCSSRKEGDAEIGEEEPKIQYPALQQSPGSAPRDTHNNIFKFVIELKPPTNGRCQLSSFQRRPSEARLKEPEKFIKRLPETRIKECRLCTHPNLTSNPTLEPFAIKLLTKSSWWDTVFEDRESDASPFAWQSNKALLSYFP